MPKRKKNSNTENGIHSGQLIALGLDIGYGVGKAITDEGAITFPSVV